MNRKPVLLEIDRRPAFAVFSLVAGVLSILLLVVTVKSMPPDSSQQLSFLASHRMAYILSATVILSWAVFSIPFLAGLGKILRPKSSSLAFAATILSAIGISLLGFGVFTHVGALLSIAAAGNPPSSADAAYQVAIWTNLGYYLTDPGLMTWGLGQFLFGWLAWRSQALPNWLSILGTIGGIAGLLTLAVYQTATLAFVQLGSFAVWGFTTGVILVSNRGRRLVSEPSVR